MTWQHRVLRRVTPSNIPGHEPDVTFGIHEVFSSVHDPDKVGGPTVEAVALVKYSVDDLRWTLTEMLKCLDAPVLEYDTCAGEPMFRHEPQITGKCDGCGVTIYNNRPDCDCE